MLYAFWALLSMLIFSFSKLVEMMPHVGGKVSPGWR